MSFSIRINESAARELGRVAKPDRSRVVAAILATTTGPVPTLGGPHRPRQGKIAKNLEKDARPS